MFTERKINECLRNVADEANEYVTRNHIKGYAVFTNNIAELDDESFEHVYFRVYSAVCLMREWIFRAEEQRAFKMDFSSSGNMRMSAEDKVMAADECAWTWADAKVYKELHKELFDISGYVHARTGRYLVHEYKRLPVTIQAAFERLYNTVKLEKALRKQKKAM